MRLARVCRVEVDSARPVGTHRGGRDVRPSRSQDIGSPLKVLLAAQVTCKDPTENGRQLDIPIMFFSVAHLNVLSDSTNPGKENKTKKVLN